MCAQMRNFLDRTGSLWMKGALVGKVGSVFASAATQHGGKETTIGLGSARREVAGGIVAGYRDFAALTLSPAALDRYCCKSRRKRSVK